MGERQNNNRVVTLNGNEREWKAMQQQSFRAKTCSLACCANERWVGFSKQVDRCLKGIYQPGSKPGLFRLVPKSRFFKLPDSILADCYMQI